MKTAPTEKMEYTITRATENLRNSSFQILDFQTFVTEIFRFKVCDIYFFLKVKKSANFNEFGRYILGASLTPRLKLIGGKRSSVRVLQPVGSH